MNQTKTKDKNTIQQQNEDFFSGKQVKKIAEFSIDDVLLDRIAVLFIILLSWLSGR